MSTSPDKDYIDAKSEAISAAVSGEIKAFRAEVSARLDKMNARLDAQEQLIRFGQKSLQEEFNTKFAQLESTFRRAHSDMLKWVLGAILAGLGLSLSISTLLLTNAAGKTSAPAPAVSAPQTAPSKLAPPSPR